MVHFKPITLILLYGINNIQAGIRTTKQTKQTHKQYYERLKTAFPGETLNSKELEVLVETSTGYLTQDKIKHKRQISASGKSKTDESEESESLDSSENSLNKQKSDEAEDGYMYNPRNSAVVTDDDLYDDVAADETDVYDENGRRMRLDPALKTKYDQNRNGDKRPWQKRSRSEHAYYREQYGYECYDTVEDQYFRKNDKWTTVRNLTNAPAGVTAFYSCRCEGGDTGRYICSPTQVPCYSRYTEKYHSVGSEFEIQTDTDEYVCYCYGGPTGKYECEEKKHGCYDNKYNLKKYGINEKFTQTRADGYTYDCECQYGSTLKERVIICRLSRYCFVNEDALEIGDQFDIYAADGSVEHRCMCKKNPKDERSNVIHCRFVGKPQRVKQVATEAPATTEDPAFTGNADDADFSDSMDLDEQDRSWLYSEDDYNPDDMY